MPDTKRALISLAVGREVIRRVVGTLQPAAIPVMPLKGIWLQARVYAAHEPRVITDVDLLVPEDRFDTAIACLERAGFRRRSANVSEASLSHSELALPVDLHRRLFTRSSFRLSTADMFARAGNDASTFGVPVSLPDPRDVFAHLVGHFVKSRTRVDDSTRLLDFVMIAERCAFSPQDHAQHLHSVGMARAARYALHELAYRRSLPFFDSLLRALPADPLGERLVRWALGIGEGPLAQTALAPLAGFMLDRSLPAGGRALLLRALDLRHDRPPR